jgi:predicted nucleic acid-binding protein
VIFAVDASVAVKWFLPERYSDRAAAYLSPECQLVAPDLILLEVGNVLLKAARRKEITAVQSKEALAYLLPGAVRMVPAAEHAEPAFAIAERHGGSLYDAVYVAVARSLDVPVLTDDRQLAAVAERAKVRTLTLEDAPPRAES